MSARRGLLAKVHIGRKELALDEATYRDVLREVTGHESAADCTEAQLGQVLDRFKARGWTPGVVAGGKPAGAARARAADHPSAKKARALWISLHQLGVVRNASDQALEAFAARQLKVERLQWADQAQCYKLVEALKAMAERAGWSQDLAGVPPQRTVRELKERLVMAQFATFGETFWPTKESLKTRKDLELDALIARLAHRIWSPADG